MKQILDQVVAKLCRVADEIGDKIPYVAKGKTFDDYSFRPSWWTNGFWPGILWHMYEYTKDEKYMLQARAVQKKLDTVLEEFVNVDHDAGFIWHISSVQDFVFSGDLHAKVQGMKAASYLASRFNPSGNYIRAWNGEWAEGHAIIDTLLNIPLLYWASKVMQDNRFIEIATRHADTAIKEFIRDDGSVYHIVVFDKDGKRSGQRYGQGYSEQSSWGRGTSWALYGMALSYKHTAKERYLDAAKKVAKFIISHMPDDFVPPCDYLAPDELRKTKDSSAGAITACGFILLGRLTGDNFYTEYGKKIVKGLYDTCFAPADYQALLLHGNVAYHAEDISDTDLSIIYGDYYFLEALLMLEGHDEFF